MQLFYGDIVAGGGTPPPFASMVRGAKAYIATTGEKIHYGRSHPSTAPKPETPRLRTKDKTLWKLYPDTFCP